MAEERTVHREVRAQAVDDVAPERVEQETETTETRQVAQVVPVAPAPAAAGSTNVNVTPDATTAGDATATSGGSVSINTPGGTQVNVNR
jgi:hypothetical protein